MEFISEAMHASIDLSRPASHEPSYELQSNSALNSNVMLYYRPIHQEVPSSESPLLHYYSESTHSTNNRDFIGPDNLHDRENHGLEGNSNQRRSHYYEHPAEALQYPIYLTEPIQQSGNVPLIIPENWSFSYFPLNPVDLPTNCTDYNGFTTQYHPVASTSQLSSSDKHNKGEAMVKDNAHSSGRTLKRKHSHSSESDGQRQEKGEESKGLPNCAVCGDSSTGIHYGIWACEGCKGFFRRAMARKSSEPPFTCYYSLECAVNRETRNKCRACRLRRCQEAGMIYSGSKEGKRRRPSKSVSSPSMEIRSAVELQWKEYVVSAHGATFTPVSDIFMSRYASVITLSPMDLWPSGSDIGTRGFQTVRLFSKALPFFSCLPSDLRAQLLEVNALDIMLLRMAYRFCPERDAFLFPPGTEVTLDCLSSTQLGSGIANRLSALGRAMIRLGVGSEELAFLSTLALLSTDNIIVNDHTQTGLLKELENNVLKAFQYYMNQRWTSRPTLVGKLIILLLDVRMLQYSAPLSAWLEPKIANQINIST